MASPPVVSFSFANPSLGLITVLVSANGVSKGFEINVVDDTKLPVDISGAAIDFDEPYSVMRVTPVDATPFALVIHTPDIAQAWIDANNSVVTLKSALHLPKP